jgi:CubicO group peptidase (beta-lactamase class C family)
MAAPFSSKKSIGKKFFAAVSLFAALTFFSAAPLGAPCFAASAPRMTNEQREFSSFIDGFLAAAGKERRVPGMAVAAVKNGETLYLQGYGVADLSTGESVDAEKTVFRIGPVTKAVTAAAIMQLAERERIFLDEDVNVYLRRWKIRGTFVKPITLRNFLTCTAGLDYERLEKQAPTSKDEREYPAKLPKIIPARFAEPGTFYDDSAMGYAVLGSIIERFARLDLPDAVKTNIFDPLGMDSSAYAPYENGWKNFARGYDEKYEPVPYTFRYDLAAVGMSSTARDMSRFMIAQLSGGVLGRKRILSQKFSESMLRRHFSPNPKINGAGLGYVEKTVAGVRTLWQSGEIDGFSSLIMLIPENNFGLFFAANSAATDFKDEMASSVVERFFPVSEDKVPISESLRNAFFPDVLGFYRSNKISRHTAEKISCLFDRQLEAALDGNFITVRSVPGDGPVTRWLPDESSADLFRRVGDDGNFEDEYMFFQRDANKAVSAMIIGGVENTFDRLAGYESWWNQLKIIAGFAAAAIFSFIGTFVGSAINRGKFPWETDMRSDTELWGISSIFCGMQIFFVAGILVAIAAAGREFSIFVPYQVKALFVVPLAGGHLLAWFWFRLVSKILSPDHHWFEKILLTCLAFVETGYMFFLAAWRLLGFMF